LPEITPSPGAAPLPPSLPLPLPAPFPLVALRSPVLAVSLSDAAVGPSVLVPVPVAGSAG
jgi:hypothetical protein